MDFIFDWSGTLADDQALTWELTDRTLAELGCERVDFETYRREFTLPASGFYRRRAPGRDMERIEALFGKLCSRFYPGSVRLHSGASSMLHCLAGDHRLHVLSSLETSLVEAALERLGLRPLFANVVGGARDKAEILQRHLSALAPNRAEALLIGDTPHDLEAARANGLQAGAALYGYASRRLLLAANPDVAFDSPGDIRSFALRETFAAGGIFPLATVGGLVLGPGREALLVRTEKWSSLFGIPGGKIHYGETMEQALRREIREETGQEIDSPRFIMVQDCVEHPQFHRPRHFILVNYLAWARRGRDGSLPEVRLNYESSEYRWVDPRRALSLPLNDPTRILIERVLEMGLA